MIKQIGIVLIVLTMVDFGKTISKYSAEANLKPPDKPWVLNPNVNFRTLDKPFRMAKLNLLWSKAQRRLTDVKLKSLFSDLKIHDKEEIAWKRFKSDGNDKDGLKEAELREKLIGIMSTYSLLEHFQDVNDPKKVKVYKAMNDPSISYINKSLFKDKRLNQLWEKAEKAGFTAEELQALHEEFNHHQQKIDEYYSLLQEVENDPDSHKNSINDNLDHFNMLTEMEDKPNVKYETKVNQLRDLNTEVRDGFDRLNLIAAKGPNSKEFIEPQVQNLWMLAVNSNFTNDELESLKTELLHYEHRLMKLRHLHAEAEFHLSKSPKVTGEKPAQGLLSTDEIVKKQEKKVAKLRLDLETKIMQKHIEL
ncbi:alpha-2-macroglobulin receptor-associated protein precursor, putative [Pediculus humanus corporis]|uniref:Alpha-2-macroglobulin receptor-associated protein, putative n=1 Tax=Pediculus humanus subsp. corporis TaxID=121224 RepID=E0VW23_PEDHC|nr:alpha-2-macroglobulin receptor-associated protein precursor, putative [Pediculus humanus corporis]EEB17579.1 alpha-2-macroglobulin receptor-associated protein precursor, putative [Pediculus humanus corporis]